jgi:hypothetical protein
MKSAASSLKCICHEIMGAGVVRFEFNTDGHLDIFLVTTWRSAVTWPMSLTKEKGSIVL